MKNASSLPVCSPSGGLGGALIESWMGHYQPCLWYRLASAEGKEATRQEAQWTNGSLHGTTRLLAPGPLLGHGVVHHFADSLSLTARPGPAGFVAGIRAAQYPRSAWLPVAHLRLDYTETAQEAWFSGDFILTPPRIDDDQLGWMHEQLAQVRAALSPGWFQHYRAGRDSQLCEMRPSVPGGSRGFWFDRLVVGDDGLFEELLAFVQDVGALYGSVYVSLMRQYTAQTTPACQREQLSRTSDEVTKLVRGEEFYPGLSGAALPDDFRRCLVSAIH